jgi:hypothetical protein
VSCWAARRTYADRGLEADSGVTAAFKQWWYSGGAVRHPHVPVRVRAMLGGGEADAVHGWLRWLFLPQIRTTTTEAVVPLPDPGAPTCSKGPLHLVVQQQRI